MIPPSIVLIIFGLITETSIKALFTAAFLPGFMLASFFIIYIIVRTQLNPDQAPLPEPKPGDPQGAEKWALFGAFMSIIVGGFSAVLLLRVLFFTVTGQNVYVEGVDEIAYGTPIIFLVWCTLQFVWVLIFLLLELKEPKLAGIWVKV